jgi:hypothetical protein
MSAQNSSEGGTKIFERFGRNLLDYEAICCFCSIISVYGTYILRVQEDIFRQIVFATVLELWEISRLCMFWASRIRIRIR